MNYKNLIAPLMVYSNDKLGFMTDERKENIEAIYNIIADNAAALHGDKYVAQQAAVKYFKSTEFEQHCKYAYISKNLMMHIVENSPKQVARNESAK